jgi:N-acetylglucosaminyl-diphospho-decaprenol L-rhamnosyltransferase
VYFEDVGLGYRFGRAGHRNVDESAAAVTYTGARSRTHDSVQMVRAHHPSTRRLLLKKWAQLGLKPVRVALSAGLAVR